MSTLASEAMVNRLLESARQRVVTGMALMSRPTTDSAVQLADDLHTLAGEAAMLDRPELAKVASEGELAARSWATGKVDALVPCMRSLRRLSYMLHEDDMGDEGRSGPGARVVPSIARKLLIVDDSPVAALALADVFEMNEFSVRVASSIGEAFAIVDSFQPDILVSDVHMPNLDVAELCRGFRERAGARKVAVILVSGRSENELRERLEAIDPDAFVSKLAGAVAVVTRVSAICRDVFV
jgi:CheY-like chemotaxis protein/HPt (histidine-containing phosphotransfer) domain-containing protein